MNNLITGFLSSVLEYFTGIKARKTKIRKDMRYTKKGLTVEEKQQQADAVFSKIESLPEFKSAKVILSYWAMPDELPTQAIIAKWCEEKQILLPSIDGNRLVLKQYLPDGQLIQKSLGIWEPDLSKNYEGNVDLVIVPGIAFDRKKNRLGRGKGYYDRFFKKFKPFKIGVGFDFQMLQSIPTARHDIKMNLIITPSETI
jgi:5-formyltetrahydrofolate cyclo-ligase